MIFSAREPAPSPELQLPPYPQPAPTRDAFHSNVPLDDDDLVGPPRKTRKTRETKETVCPHCKADMEGENLILSFDGTSNQYGNKNTNVIELYARIDKKDGSQLTYYSGIGTYARPSWRSYKYWKQVIGNRVDLAIAWNFEKGVLAGYRWLCNHYRPGHKIFLFGFSRGAHQVRALAAMIAKVGLILPGNEEQIPFAYELYADLKAHSNKGYDGGKSAQFFKKAFCRDNVRIHFLGAWDAVSSIGIVKGKNLPGTDTFDDDNNICFFRHALALDERRVKFLPEYICGEKSYEKERPGGGLGEPRVKEVWFAGTHSDVGGGNKVNDQLTNGDVPLLWMGHEALRAGLRLDDAEGDSDWKWEQLERSEPTESLTGLWRLFELLPIKRLSYKNPSVTRRPHLGKGRVIQPGQKIHASVAFIKDYEPKATLPEEANEWEDILEKGNTAEISWIRGLEDILELDLFDLSNMSVLIRNAMSSDTEFNRLHFLTSIRDGVPSIAKAEPDLGSFAKMLTNSTRGERTGQMLLKLAGSEDVRRALIWTKVIGAMAASAAVEVPAEVPAAAEILAEVPAGAEVPKSLHIDTVFQLLSLLFKDGIRHFTRPEATTHIETILKRLPEDNPLYREASALFCVVDVASPITDLHSTFYKKYRNRNLPAIREGVTHFKYFLHLHNRDKNTSIAGVALEMHRVVDGHPDEHAGNMISDNTAWLRSDPSARYCFTIRNPSPHKLFPYLFYFNPHDCAIDCFYEPPNRHRPPLRRLEDLLTVGMGAEPAFQFMLPPGMPSSSGFFKLFVSTNYVDLGWIEQRPSLENYPVQELYARVFNPETLRDSYWADLQVMLVLNKGDDEVIPQLDGDPDTTTIRQEDTRTGPQEMARPPSLPPSPSSSNADKAVFALIIGINKYQSTDFSTIRGAVNDAKAFESYLLDPREKQGLAVPASNIVLLLNEQATRENILETFRSHFLNNPNIPDGGKTTMILFFAGHGSRIEAPDNLLSRDGKVSAICPYDCDRTPNASGNNVSSIPEYILGRLLSELAVKKGPNITVILDSAHAGGMGRNVGGISGVTPPIELDSDLKDKIDSEMSRPFRMWPQSMTSYCLLAACGDEDMCYETPAQDNQLVHGRFTYHLIDQLRKAPLENTTYTELLNLIPTLPNQIPQCSGSWRYCLVFSTNYPVRGSRRALPT